MRTANYVFVLAAALEKRLGLYVAVMQTDRYTEWRVGDWGFAVGPTPASYPPKELLNTMVVYFTKHLPREKNGKPNKRDNVH